MACVMGNLPVVTTSFVGRDSELDSIDRALRDHRLVTLSGSGGVGKSRLALQTAGRVGDRYADGVWWADLSHLDDDQLLTTTVCDGVGLLDHSARRPVAALCEWLSDRRLLLVLDCCERLVDSCRQLVTELLAAAPGLTVLATSRQPLGAEGEHAVQVHPLSAGEDGDEAVRLFHDRAAAVVPGLALDSPVTRPPWPRSAVGSKGYRWPSNWPAPSSARAAPRRSPGGWPPGWTR